MAIENGKIVWLKTGGPAMTVKYENQTGDWVCTWFDGKTVREHNFAEEQLTETEPEDFD